MKYFDEDKLGVARENRSWDFAQFQSSTADASLGVQGTVLFPKIKSD